MAEQWPSEGESQYTGFSYFMIRVQRPVPTSQATMSGLIERLGTGEKKSFHTGAQLLELLGAWSADSKMQADASVGNGQATE